MGNKIPSQVIQKSKRMGLGCITKQDQEGYILSSWWTIQEGCSCKRSKGVFWFLIMKKKRTRSIHIVLMDEDQRIQLDRDVIYLEEDSSFKDEGSPDFDQYTRDMFYYMIDSVGNFD